MVGVEVPRRLQFLMTSSAFGRQVRSDAPSCLTLPSCLSVTGGLSMLMIVIMCECVMRDS